MTEEAYPLMTADDTVCDAYNITPRIITSAILK